MYRSPILTTILAQKLREMTTYLKHNASHQSLTECIKKSGLSASPWPQFNISPSWLEVDYPMQTYRPEPSFVVVCIADFPIISPFHVLA